MRIGLFGFTFTHGNMGCQALTCAFLELLRKNFPQEHIEIVSFFEEASFGEIPELFPEFTFERKKISLKKFKASFWDEIHRCDIIFDETYGDGFSDIYFFKSMYRDVLIKYLCGKSNVPFVMTPQTYGPFRHKSLEWFAGRAIKAATEIYSRDEISAAYAEKLSSRSVITVTDLAFALPFQIPDKRQQKRKKLGLNVSGLLWKGGFYEQNQFGLKTDYRTYCRKIAEYVRENDMELHIIPHVTKSSSEYELLDGDYPACTEIAKEFEDAVLAPCFATPYEAKNYIAEMDYFIGARMHATIGAFSAGVVTIPFAYSRKFKGLYENFGYSYYVDGTELGTEDALGRTIDYIQQAEQLKERQMQGLLQATENIQVFEKELIRMIESVAKKV